MANSDPQQPEPIEAAPRPSPSRSRHVRRPGRAKLPWLWLGIAFLVVLILAAVVYLAQDGLSTQPSVLEPTATPTAVVQPTSTPKQPSPTPTPAARLPTATSESTPSEAEIKPGIKVQVVGTGVDGLSFRSGPGRKYTRLKTVPDGETFTVLEGPEEADGHRWWRLQDKTGTIGWGVDKWLQPTGQ